MIQFADAVLGSDSKQLDDVRGALTARLGQEAVVDTAAVIGTFDAIDRIADACGIPIEEYKEACLSG